MTSNAPSTLRMGLCPSNQTSSRPVARKETRRQTVWPLRYARAMADSRASWLAFATSVLVGAGCAPDTWPTHVACVGDSITEGDGASAPTEAYPAALQGMLGARTLVRNFGHSASTALGPGAGSLPYELQPEFAAATDFVAQAGPDARVAVVVLLGANDSRAASWDAPGRKERFRADYEKLVGHFTSLATHPTVYVAEPLGVGASPCCGVRGDILTHDIVPVVVDVARAHNLPTIDLTQLTKGHPELLVDGVHPNDKGYEALAAIVRDELVSHPPVPQHSGSWLTHIFR
jgi:lysophospholipase L1-like esterase